MGSKRNVDMSSTETKIKVVETETPEVSPADSGANTDLEGAPEATAPASIQKAQKARSRSPKYQASRARVDKTHLYDPADAAALVKELSYTKFAGTITAHGVIKEPGDVATLSFPHSTGRSIRVGIVDEALLKQIEAGELEYDVLVAAPQFMPKLAKHARILGPKGLMPNPKRGTVTDNPEMKKKELESGTFELKTERKAPVFHVRIGSTAMETAELIANLQYLIEQIGPKLKKLTLSATMSPGVKVRVR